MRVVINPDTTFEKLAAILVNAGWSRVEIAGLLPPLIPGEPEQALFEKANDRLIYSFNPALFLRVLDGAVPDGIPVLSAQDIGKLLASDDPSKVLLGVNAAAESAMQAQYNDIVQAVTKLPPNLQQYGQAAIARLAPLPDADTAAAFIALPTGLKRANLRILMAQSPLSAASVVPSCWGKDAELSATAMIACARLGLTDQAAQISRADLTQLGRTRREKEVFRTLPKVVLATLSGQNPQDNNAPKNVFWRSVLGTDTQLDIAGLILRALTLPLPDLPEQDDWPLLYPNGPAFRQVSAIPHWLGFDQAKAVNERIREWVPDRFMICETPLRECDVGGSMDNPVLTENPAALVARISKRFDLPIRLPSPDEWECAMRGPDGRPYPWGLRKQPVPANRASPWGLLGASVAEWAMDGTTLLLIGGPSGTIAAQRDAPDRNSKAAVRLVLETDN